MMIKKNLYSRVCFLTIILFNSSLVHAEEIEDPSTFNYWTFLILIAILIAFKKKLFHEATPEKPHDSHADHGHTETHSAPKAKSTVAASTSTAEAIIDLSTKENQCQGTTTRGTRCSRTTGLETIEVTRKGKKYRLLACKQHHSDTFAPYSELI